MFRLVPQALLSFVFSILLLAPAQAARHHHFQPGTSRPASNQGSFTSEAAPRMNGTVVLRQRVSDSTRSRHRLAAEWRGRFAPIARYQTRSRPSEWGPQNLAAAGWNTAAVSDRRYAQRNVWAQAVSSEPITTVSHPSGCPASAYCGCGASVQVFGHPVRELWLASNWFRFPPTSPGPGMAAVRAHHVMVIMEMRGNGHAVVYDANSGSGATHIHETSLAGYSIRNPHAGWQPRS
jgi:hypothetical protein